MRRKPGTNGSKEKIWQKITERMCNKMMRLIILIVSCTGDSCEKMWKGSLRWSWQLSPDWRKQKNQQRNIGAVKEINSFWLKWKANPRSTKDWKLDEWMQPNEEKTNPIIMSWHEHWLRDSEATQQVGMIKKQWRVMRHQKQYMWGLGAI